MNQSELKKILNYDPESGIFTWLESSQRRSIGDKAGNIESRGYVNIVINRVRYRAHRLAWLYMTGSWPAEVDHINLVKYDNRWINLREVNSSQQHANGPLQINNTSGHKGVSWRADRGKWQAYIKKDGKTRKLGSFSTKEEAAAAYKKAAEELFGEFAHPI